MAESQIPAGLASLQHSHDHGAEMAAHERGTRWVVALTLAMMLTELAVGYATNSLALTADGWHMATHAGALGLSAFAYWFARERAASTAFSFGTGKVHALAGYTSAVGLALIALLMVVESCKRFLHPEPIAFREALPVAVLGLVVNLLSVKLLHSDEHHNHDHDHDGEHGGHDHNLRAAYFHVLADALTSVLAIGALLGGRYLGLGFLDSAMGVVGGLVIARWSFGLCRDAARQLLDVVPATQMRDRIRHHIESAAPGTHVVDLHLWEIGPRSRACIVSVAAREPKPAAAYRELLLSREQLTHVTVEVHQLSTGEASAST